MIKKYLPLALSMLLSTALFASINKTPASIVSKNICTVYNSSGDVGKFTAEGKTYKTKFVRVLFAAEGSEKEGGSNSIVPLIYDSKDPQGNDVKVRRFQITTKNTGYDEVQTSKEEDYKMKSVEEGAKLHIENPVAADGSLQLDRAYVGNAAYNFGTRETRQNLSPDNSSDIKINIKKLDLPQFSESNKPGDKGLIYNQGFIDFTFSAKVRHISSDQISDFTVEVKGPISLTHIRGKEREKAATQINPGIVAKNVK